MCAPLGCHPLDLRFRAEGLGFACRHLSPNVLVQKSCIYRRSQASREVASHTSQAFEGTWSYRRRMDDHATPETGT